MSRQLKTQKPISIRWSGLVKIEDICLKKSRFGNVYAVLYTNSGINICSPEQEAAKLCLYEPYEMRGTIKQFLGGQYLKLEKAYLFDPSGYRHVIV